VPDAQVIVAVQLILLENVAEILTTSSITPLSFIEDADKFHDPE